LGGERFLREVSIAAKLNHPHILALHDSGEAGEFLYYVMPYVEGESLRAKLNREKQLSVDEAISITKQTGAALDYAHEQGVIHRDIKPENILMYQGEALVADFGIALAVSAAGGTRLTDTGLSLGTPEYMSPEQATGERELDGRSDLYALGCVLFEMLAGEPPYTGSTVQAVLAKKLGEPTPHISVIRETVPPAIEAALMKALAKTPADRFQTADELLPQLDALATPSGGVTPAGMMPEDRQKKRRWMMVGGAVAGATVIAVIAVLALRGSLTDAGSGIGVEGEAASRRMVVVPLENRTRDPNAADWGLMAAEFVTRAIDRAGIVIVVPATHVRDVVLEMDPAVRLSVAEIANRTGARYAVAGSYTISAGQVRFDVELVDAETGDMLRALDPVSGPADSLENVVGTLAEQVTVAVVAHLDPESALWLAQSAMPTSLDVFRGYMTLVDVFCQSRYQDAIDVAQPYMRTAPDYWRFAYLVSAAYGYLGRDREGDSVAALMEPFLDQMNNFDRLSFEWIHGLRHGDLDEATRAGEQLYRLLPEIYGYYAGRAAKFANRLNDALERLLANDIDTRCYRNWVPPWIQTAEVHHLLGRYDEELAVARHGLERFPNRMVVLDAELRALVGLGRLGAVDSLLGVIANLPVEEGYPLGRQLALTALELKAHGHHTEYQAAVDWALAWFASQPASELRYDRGLAFFYAEQWSDADTLFAALIADAPDNFDYRGFRGVALAQLARDEEAMEIAVWLEELDRPFLRGSNTRWRAAIAAALGDRDRAVRLLQQAIGEGFWHGIWQHRDPEWDPLRDYPPFQVLIRPKG
jgi:tetratricopeptide (TPR) repeat protein